MSRVTMIPLSPVKFLICYASYIKFTILEKISADFLKCVAEFEKMSSKYS